MADTEESSLAGAEDGTSQSGNTVKDAIRSIEALKYKNEETTNNKNTPPYSPSTYRNGSYYTKPTNITVVTTATNSSKPANNGYRPFPKLSEQEQTNTAASTPYKNNNDSSTAYKNEEEVEEQTKGDEEYIRECIEAKGNCHSNDFSQ